MAWFVSILVSLISGIAGLFVAGFIAGVCVSWYSIPSREGASGFYVMFWALAGGIAGVVIGLIASRVVVENVGASFVKELGAAVGAVLVIGLVTLGLCRFLADVAPTLDGRELNLEVEFRLPASGAETAPTSDGAWAFKLGVMDGNMQRRERDGEVRGEKARLEDGRWIVPCDVYLYSERSKRAVSLKRDDKDVGGFLLSMPGHPGHEFEQWSEWLPRQQADGSAWPSDKTSYRFRIQKEPEPPPAMTEAEYKAAQERKKEEEIEAIADDAPISAWFTYTKYEQPQTKRALEKIAGRVGYVEELRVIALGDDAEAAHDAMRCIGLLPEPSKELVSVIEQAAKRIVEGIEKFNGTSAEADPSFEGAVDPTTRFYGWMEAARALREKAQGDFVPELKRILELSRERPDSHCMRQDICRVASYYLQQWAGIEPLATDPKPR